MRHWAWTRVATPSSPASHPPPSRRPCSRRHLRPCWLGSDWEDPAKPRDHPQLGRAPTNPPEARAAPLEAKTGRAAWRRKSAATLLNRTQISRRAEHRVNRCLQARATRARIFLRMLIPGGLGERRLLWEGEELDEIKLGSKGQSVNRREGKGRESVSLTAILKLSNFMTWYNSTGAVPQPALRARGQTFQWVLAILA